MEDATWVSYKKTKIMILITFSLKKKHFFLKILKQAQSYSCLSQLNGNRLMDKYSIGAITQHAAET